MSSRVAIFVDGANMFYAQRDNKWSLEYKKVYEYFTTNKEAVMAFYFTATPPPTETERWKKYKAFRQALIHMGYRVIDKEVQVFHNKETGQVRIKGNLDIDMAFQMLIGKDKYDDVVVLGGDSDFIPIFEHLRNLGKTVICVGRRASTGLELINAASQFVDLDQIRTRVEKENRRRS